MNRVMPATWPVPAAAANDIAGADLSLVERFQIDLDSPAVQRRVGAIDADERRKAFHGGILQDDLGQRCCRFAISGKDTVCAASETP